MEVFWWIMNNVNSITCLVALEGVDIVGVEG